MQPRTTARFSSLDNSALETTSGGTEDAAYAYDESAFDTSYETFTDASFAEVVPATAENAERGDYQIQVAAYDTQAYGDAQTVGTYDQTYPAQFDPSGFESQYVVDPTYTGQDVVGRTYDDPMQAAQSSFYRSLVQGGAEVEPVQLDNAVAQMTTAGPDASHLFHTGPAVSGWMADVGAPAGPYVAQLTGDQILLSSAHGFSFTVPQAQATQQLPALFRFGVESRFAR